ncbi:unnamed protein product [Sphagnum jensenii]|uniref:Uncharacterized protein n=2 Tax=Sphagnum jensenii TaxID=128206 RepID=A0ABP0ZXQ8_9BRYO
MATNSYRVAHANATTENLDKQSSSVHQNDVARHTALELTVYSAVCGTLKAAIELGVFEILAKAGASASQKSLTAKEIADQLVRPTANGTAVNSGYLQRFLRLLASVNIVSESVAVVAAAEPGNFTSYNTHHQRSYALTPIGKYFVRGEDGSSLAPIILMGEDWVFKKAFDNLSAAVLDDSVDPFVRAHGKSEFQLNNDDPRVDKLFNTAMSSQSGIYMEAMLGAYHGFQDVNCLVDVGGCTGASLALITAKYPHIRGINFDLPHVVATAPTYPRVEFVGGNMFESIPSGDAIFIKAVLHNWNDEHCMTILKNCIKALPSSGGKVIVMESVLPDLINVQSENAGVKSMLGLRLDITMLAYNSRGAKERTLHEFQQLGNAVGFASVTVITTIDFVSVLEFTQVAA